MRKLSVVLCLLITQVCFSQWIYNSIKYLTNEMVVEYDVIYEKEPTDEQKKSSIYIKKIAVILSKDKLVENIFDVNDACRKFKLYDYTLNRYTSCYSYSKSGISYDFKEPRRKAVHVKDNSKKIVDFNCSKYSVRYGKGGPKNIYVTKSIGLRYCNDFDVDGFLMEYPGYSSSLGNYTVRAKKVYSLKVPKGFFSLEDYTIRTTEEVKISNDEYRKEKAEKNAAHIGQKCPKFRVRTIDNKKISSKAYTENKKIMVLNFCYLSKSFSKYTSPKLNDLREQYKDDANVEFIAFAIDGKKEVKEFLMKSPFNYDIVDDARWHADKFEIKSYPTNIIVDQNGVIQFFETGYKSSVKSMMTSKIDELLEE